MRRAHRYRDRRHAGEALAGPVAEAMARLEVPGTGTGGVGAPLVLALPRGGVPVAAPVAERLGAELDVLLVRKVGVPGHEELAMGAVADGGVVVRNDDVLRVTGVDDAAFDRAVARSLAELERRGTALRGDRLPPSMAGRLVVLVDDGLATGATMRAAVDAARTAGAAGLVVAVPVGAPDVCDRLAQVADEVVCPLRPPDLGAVGAWYDDFDQTSDDEVRELLGRPAGP